MRGNGIGYIKIKFHSSSAGNSGESFHILFSFLNIINKCSAQKKYIYIYMWGLANKQEQKYALLYDLWFIVYRHECICKYKDNK